MQENEETRTEKYSSYREEINEKYKNTSSFPVLEQKKHKKKNGNLELKKYRRIKITKIILYILGSVLVVGALIGLLIYLGVLRAL